MIHPTALVSSSANIGKDVEIGPYCIIHENVTIGSKSKIGAYCELGLPTPLAKKQELLIGDNAVIRSHSVIYIGSSIGDKFVTGHHICVRENSDISEGVQIGSRGDIQGDCTIGSYTKLHADVHIGKLSKVGSYVWLFPEVLLTNDPVPPSELLLGPVIGDHAILASKVLVFPGIRIGSDAVISAGSIVKNDISEWKLAAGTPAKEVCDVRIIRMPDNPKAKAYPWRFRFHRGYPESIVDQWVAELSAIGNKQ